MTTSGRRPRMALLGLGKREIITPNPRRYAPKVSAANLGGRSEDCAEFRQVPRSLPVGRCRALSALAGHDDGRAAVLAEFHKQVTRAWAQSAAFDSEVCFSLHAWRMGEVGSGRAAPTESVVNRSAAGSCEGDVERHHGWLRASAR